MSGFREQRNIQPSARRVNLLIGINLVRKIRKNKMVFPKDKSPVVMIGDVKEKLQDMKKRGIKVDTIITSPPYWGQRDYGVKGQIGAEQTPEEYINNMLEVADNLKEVLKDSGSYFLNIGDKFVDKKLQMVPFRLAAEMQNRGWVLRNVIVWHKPNHMPSSLKDRLNTVWEPIFFFVKDTGKYYTQKYYVNIDEIREKHKNGNGEKKKTLSVEEFKKLNLPTKPNGKDTYNGKFTNTQRKNLGASPGARKSVGGEYWSLQRKHEIDDNKKAEIITYLKEQRKKVEVGIKDIDKKFGYSDTAGHWFRLDRGGSLPKPEDWKQLKQILKLDNKYDKIMLEQHYVLQTVAAHPKGKNPGDYWSIPLEKLKDSHFAIFPTELPSRIIKAFCPKDGIVLDPFAGSGTTGKAAKELGRHSVLIDLNKEFVKIMEKRCGGVKLIE